MIRGLLASMLVAASCPAWALNMSGFREAPVTRLSTEELREFRGVVVKTLDETKDGVTVEWKAPKTKFVSKVTPQKTFTDGKAKCREATIESDAHDRFQRGLYTFCKNAKGDWQFKFPSGKSQAK
jgi:surface antigen